MCKPLAELPLDSAGLYWLSPALLLFRAPCLTPALHPSTSLQVTVGDCNIDKPSGWMAFEATAKWEAWNSVKGTSKEDAQAQYIALVTKLLA